MAKRTSVENFFRNALCNPDHLVSYYASEALAAMFPDRARVEGYTSFSLTRYSKAGECEVVKATAVHSQVRSRWTGKKLKHSPANAWFQVLWRGHMLDVVLMSWDYTEYCWVLAESREVAEAFLASASAWCSEVRGEVLVFENGCWRRDKDLYREIASATMDTLVLPASLKQEIRDDLTRFFASREIYEKYGISWKRGVLFIGPPGNGKTHAVKALVNLLGKPCLYVKSLKSPHNTDHGNIGAVFERARRAAPCVLVLEDLDSLVEGAKRAPFLNELDGFAVNAGVATLATTNHPERIDDAILERPSRFDRKYQFDLPGSAERLEFIRRWNCSMQADVRLSEQGMARAAGVTAGFSFAYLKELCVASLMRWVERPAAGSMDAVMLDQARALRAQMGGEKAKARAAAAGPTS